MEKNLSCDSILPMSEYLDWPVYIVAILMAITCHEYAHGWVADKNGDPTARLSGRLTFNPMAHLDMMGALCLLLFHFGWAKPVPVNFDNLNNPRRDMCWVALAGPGANFLLALLSALFLKIIVVAIFPLASSWEVPVLRFFTELAQASIMINLGLGLFNLIPLPPLDGSKVLYSLLPAGATQYFFRIERYGILILLLLMVSHAFDFLVPVLLYFRELLVNL